MTVPPEAVEAAAKAVPFASRDAVRRVLEAAAPHMTPGVVWLVRDPATCPGCPCGGDVTAIFPTEPEAAVFTACIPSRRLVIEKWPVPGHE